MKIKFRKAKILEMMNSLDSQYTKLKAASSHMTKNAEELSGIKNELAVCEK